MSFAQDPKADIAPFGDAPSGSGPHRTPSSIEAVLEQRLRRVEARQDALAQEMLTLLNGDPEAARFLLSDVNEIQIALDRMSAALLRIRNRLNPR